MGRLKKGTFIRSGKFEGQIVEILPYGYILDNGNILIKEDICG